MNHSKAAVSVCLPILNGERHLESAIESVLAQSFEDFELILVDDSSDDSSFEIAQEYARQDKRVRVFRNDSRKGLFANYNVCLSRAKGEFIKPFAQDDILAPFYLDVAVSCLRASPEVGLFTAARAWIDDDGNDVSGKYGSPFVSDYFSQPGPLDGDAVIETSLDTLINFIGEPLCVTFRRGEKAVNFDEEFLHLGDLDMWLRLIKNGKIHYTDQKLCKFRRHDGSETNKNLESLAVAPDMMRLYKKLPAYTFEPEKFSCDLLDKAVRLISDHFKIVESINPKVSSEVIKQLSRSDLELISGHALTLIGDRQESDRETYRLATETIRLEKKLRRYLEDPFWRVTRPLRETKKLFFPNNESEFEQIEVGFNQIDYVNLLKRKIAAVKLSRTLLLKKVVGKILRLDFSVAGSKASTRAKLHRLKSRSGSTKVCVDSLNTLIKHEFIKREELLPKPKVSVLLGFMRHSPVKALDALKNQTLADDHFEVVCVDSSGIDDISEDLKIWSEENKSATNFSIVRTGRAGRAFANNVCLRLSKSSLVILLASDFVPGPDFVEQHLRFHESKDEGNLVAIGGAEFDNDGSKSGFQKWLDESGVVFGVSFVGRRDIPADFFYAANTSLQKELIFRAGLFDEDFQLDAWDDYELGRRLVDIGARSLYLDEALCKHVHGVTFLERIKLMKDAADAALTFDMKNPGIYPWHKEIEKPTFRYAVSAFVNLKKHFLTGEETFLHKCWEQSLAAAFSKSYKDSLDKQWKKQLSRRKV